MAGRKKILIIDRDAQAAAAVEALLKSGGYEFAGLAMEIDNVSSVIDVGQTDLVLMTLDANRVSAQLAAARELQNRFDVATVYLVDEAARVELEKAGGVFPSDYVMKPVIARELWVVLASALRIRKFEARILRLEARMQEVHRLESIGVVAGGIAHDFNNLITGIYGAVAIAHKELPEGSPVRQRLHHIERAATRAADLSQRLVVPPGSGSNAKARLSLNEVVEEAMKLVQKSLKPSVLVQTGFAVDLPPVFAVEAQLRQVVANLMINAAEAIGDGSGVIRVVTFIKDLNEAARDALGFPDEVKAGNYVVLEVADTGCGMEEGTITRIFDPLFSTKGANRGVGLAAVARIIRKHLGGVSVESQLSQGSCFRVFLPAHIRPPHATSATAAPMETAGTAPPILSTSDGCGKTILVVDDDEAVRALAKWVIEKAGHPVMTARDGDEALRAFQADPSRFRLVMLDLTMPRMGGLETMQKMRALKPEQRIAIVTGHGENVLSGDVQEGDVGFLQKPFSPDRLRVFLSKYAPLRTEKK